MTSVVDDKCTKCKSCVAVCPVDCFREGDNMVVINPEECIDCGVCITECPVGAICSDDEAEEKWVKFNAEKSQEWPEAEE
ncbi:MAG: 4Fe-4S dicluster domain-containing protein [Alphaproteobacteria bacterium]|nr:4Fe-4S dicluster domain-containing protein [Alphaproteobacteria bacterium]